MIASWLLYATFVGGLLGLVALLGERIVRWRAVPRPAVALARGDRLDGAGAGCAEPDPGSLPIMVHLIGSRP